MTPGRQMLELVSDLTFTIDVSADEFWAGALAIAVAALGKLPEAQREVVLANIERGELREAVDTFVARCAALEQSKRQLQ
jgi:hypothetical protein